MIFCTLFNISHRSLDADRVTIMNMFGGIIAATVKKDDNISAVSAFKQIGKHENIML